MKRATAFLLALSAIAGASAQIPGLDKIKLPSIPGLDSIFKKGPAITTSLKDAKFEAKDKDTYDPECYDLFSLDRTATGGFVLKAGNWQGTLQSYCLHAGTHGPGDGEGYLYAPPKGPYEKMIFTVAQNSVAHPEIEQTKIQMLIWAMLARAKFDDLSGELKPVATALLSANQIFELNGGALGLLSADKFADAFVKQPPALRQVFEAEANLRAKLTMPTLNYSELEQIAVLSGEAPKGKDSRDVPAYRWSLHPDGYYVRYVPEGYSKTIIQIYVPDDSKAIGKEFDPAKHVAVPGNTARQRLLQSGRLRTDGSLLAKLGLAK